MLNRSILLIISISLVVVFPLERAAANNLGEAVETSTAPSSRRRPNAHQEDVPNVDSFASDSAGIATTNSKGSKANMPPTRASTAPRVILQAGVKRLLAAIACIAAFCIAVVFGGKLQMPNASADQVGQLQLISTIKIAPRCCLSLVAANGQSFLIARDATGVKNIVSISRGFDDFVMNEMDKTHSPASQSDSRPEREWHANLYGGRERGPTSIG